MPLDHKTVSVAAVGFVVGLVMPTAVSALLWWGPYSPFTLAAAKILVPFWAISFVREDAAAGLNGLLYAALFLVGRALKRRSRR